MNAHPLHSIMVDEAEAFMEDFLPDIIVGGTKSEVYQQHDGTEHRFWFENLRIMPPAYQNANGALVRDSFDAAFHRKATLYCGVCADVMHETRVYRECVTLEQLRVQLATGRCSSGFCAVKTCVDAAGTSFVGHDASSLKNNSSSSSSSSSSMFKVPTTLLNFKTADTDFAAKWAGKAVVLIVKIRKGTNNNRKKQEKEEGRRT